MYARSFGDVFSLQLLKASIEYHELLFEKKFNREIRRCIGSRLYHFFWIIVFCEAISSCWLNTLLCVHHNSINVIFYDGLNCLFLRAASCLDAFSSYPPRRDCATSHLRIARSEASNVRSSRTRALFHSDNNTPSRYHTNCLATLLTQLTIPFNA